MSVEVSSQNSSNSSEVAKISCQWDIPYEEGSRYEEIEWTNEKLQNFWLSLIPFKKGDKPKIVDDHLLQIDDRKIWIITDICRYREQAFKPNIISSAAKKTLEILHNAYQKINNNDKSYFDDTESALQDQIESALQLEFIFRFAIPKIGVIADTYESGLLSKFIYHQKNSNKRDVLSRLMYTLERAVVKESLNLNCSEVLWHYNTLLWFLENTDIDRCASLENISSAFTAIRHITELSQHQREAAALYKELIEKAATPEERTEKTDAYAKLSKELDVYVKLSEKISLLLPVWNQNVEKIVATDCQDSDTQSRRKLLSKLPKLEEIMSMEATTPREVIQGSEQSLHRRIEKTKKELSKVYFLASVIKSSAKKGCSFATPDTESEVPESSDSKKGSSFAIPDKEKEVPESSEKKSAMARFTQCFKNLPDAVASLKNTKKEEQIGSQDSKSMNKGRGVVRSKSVSAADGIDLDFFRNCLLTRRKNLGEDEEDKVKKERDKTKNGNTDDLLEKLQSKSTIQLQTAEKKQEQTLSTVKTKGEIVPKAPPLAPPIEEIVHGASKPQLTAPKSEERPRLTRAISQPFGKEREEYLEEKLGNEIAKMKQKFDWTFTKISGSDSDSDSPVKEEEWND
jgi:hypothetical protein